MIKRMNTECRACCKAARDMLAALEAASSLLGVFYDASEDNAHNPIMRKAGRALQKADAAIAVAKAAGIK